MPIYITILVKFATEFTRFDDTLSEHEHLHSTLFEGRMIQLTTKRSIGGLKSLHWC